MQYYQFTQTIIYCRVVKIGRFLQFSQHSTAQSKANFIHSTIIQKIQKTVGHPKAIPRHEKQANLLGLGVRFLLLKKNTLISFSNSGIEILFSS